MVKKTLANLSPAPSDFQMLTQLDGKTLANSCSKSPNSLKFFPAKISTM